MVKTILTDGTKGEDIALPEVFNTKLNYVTLKKAFLAEQSEKFQLKYTDPLAGKRKVARLTKRRRSYKTSYGRGLDRTPRKTLSRVGTNFQYAGAVAPNTVGGREAHPPKAEKNIRKEINKKEKKLAIRMGIASSADLKEVSKFHKLGSINELPIILDDKVNDINKTKDAVKFLSAIGLEQELERITERKIRSGKGKLRGRKYKKKLSVVLVTDKAEKASRAFSNLNMIVKAPSSLSVSDVSQSGRPGRLIIWTKSAIEALR